MAVRGLPSGPGRLELFFVWGASGPRNCKRDRSQWGRTGCIAKIDFSPLAIVWSCEESRQHDPA